MELSIICFTAYGYHTVEYLLQKLETKKPELQKLAEIHTRCYYKSAHLEKLVQGELCTPVEGNLSEWAGEQLAAGRGILFVGAAGIAVRSVAPHLQGKLLDPPVLVMDDRGQYIIPLLSGHMGGGNELAIRLGQALGALPVITTSTDNHGVFAVDLFARRNGMTFSQKDCIAAISSKLLAGREAILLVEDGGLDPASFPQERRAFEESTGGKVHILPVSAWQGEQADLWIGNEWTGKNASIPHLCPRDLVLGMGCRRGKSPEELRAFADRILEQAGMGRERLYAIASIDRKAREEGLVELARELGVPFLTYSAEELEAQRGEFHESDFVRQQMGVGNVCERAAVCAAGDGGRMIAAKTAEDGMTAALAIREWRIRLDG